MTADRPVVSVCIAAFNAEPYLEETVASVQAQGVEALEMIIVNDGSTDGTLSLAHRLSEADDRIIVVDQPNSGSCVARNTAFERARGQYICTLDADDIWPAGKLTDQLSLLEKHPDSIVIGGVKRFRDKDGARVWGEETLPFHAADRKEYLKHLLSMPDVEKVLLNTLCAPAGFIQANNWDPEFRTGHDWEVWIRLAYKHPFIHVPQIYQFYRKHPISTTKRNRVRMVGDCQLKVIERHGPTICDSRSELNRVAAECAMHFAVTSLYMGNKRDSLYFLWRALAAGGVPLLSKRFYAVLLKLIATAAWRSRSPQTG
ncbi:glycosyltransferase family 2 protein [Marinobacter sp. NFXS9]|uniref:glycosyltransferase family 2 protein n=1 Tax=Marinobacter sp. NFXS9 TaxID=2818433 RepID=UPI0032E012DE